MLRLGCHLLTAMIHHSRLSLLSVSLKNRTGSGRIIQMYKYRALKHQDFWDRCFKMIDEGQTVPLSVRHIRDHFCARWVAVSPDEMDWYLSCIWWPAWIVTGKQRSQKS